MPGDNDHYRAISASGSVNDGTYKVLLRVVNPMEEYSSKAKPLRFANEAQDADSTGWLTLGEMTISEGACGASPLRTSGISLSPETLTLTVGETHEFTSTVSPSEASHKNIFWISDHPAIASVDSTGFVTTGPLSGQASIRAITMDGCFEAKSTITVEPLWVDIPGKLEAENFISQYGVQTENCSDIGRGLNVGWIDNGDWLQYAINNPSDSIYFTASFRLSSPGNGGLITVYLDTTEVAEIAVPYTGGWQNWKSVSTNLNIGKGEHDLNIHATSGGFNINYVDFIFDVASGINQYQRDRINIYPSPASTYINVNTGDWQFNKVDIIDISGKIVYSKEFAFHSNMNLPLHISPGMYILQLRGRDNTVSNKRIIVK